MMRSKPHPTLASLFGVSKLRKWALCFLVSAAVIFTLFVFTSLNSSIDSNSSSSVSVKQCLAKLGKSHQDVSDQLTKDEFGCPKEPPKELLDEYTQGGQIEVVDWWKCQTGPAYHKAHAYTKDQIDENVGRVKSRLQNYYGETDLFLYNAIDNFPMKGKSVAVMGSQRPIYEAVCLVFGGTSCTVIDFQPISIPPYPRYTTMTLDEYDANPIAFDAAISISSFEHDGLGRYGDPLRPNGDLDMMKKMKCIVKPDGLLYLSVPIAKDKIVWNMHRVYGRVRLPKLIEQWTLLDVFADYLMYNRWSGCDAGKEGDYQPIFVLQNRRPKNEEENLKILNRYFKSDMKPGTSCFLNKN